MLWSKITTLLAATIAFLSATIPSVDASPINSENIAFADYPEFINKRDDGVVVARRSGNNNRARDESQ
ncbi:12672_t:CDS:2 [Funneliformis mosseae]|uniref:12672_t:CDS:1 n=1 Tax=Funneliformis mosseae TaxID=27381 RepID=A0A9N9CLV5_FUNMO|nr:12672_t:CDS:2 [Funneliformis mosseae]